MLLTKARRDKYFYGASEQVRSRITEYALSLGIDHLNATVRIDHDHCIRRSLNDRAESLFAFQKRSFDLLSLIAAPFARSLDDWRLRGLIRIRHRRQLGSLPQLQAPREATTAQSKLTA